MKLYETILSILILIPILSIYSQEKSYWEQVPEEIRNKNSFKRYEWFYRPRTDKNGLLPTKHIKSEMLKEKNKIASLNKDLSGNKGTSDVWTNRGPSSVDLAGSFISHWGKSSGRVRSIAVHPTNPDIVYIGVAAGGIWKTTNGGSSWADKSGDLNLITFGAIAIDPTNPETVYAGTGEAQYNSNYTTYLGDGLYKSTDGGDSWTKITNDFGENTQFADIEVSPHFPNQLLAALSSGNYNFGTASNRGLWLSLDGGLTWTKKIAGNFFDVQFHPNPLYKKYLFASRGRNTDEDGGFYISDDSGVTFSNNSTGLPAGQRISRMQFAISQSVPTTIYSIVYNEYPTLYFFNTAAYSSNDMGLTWECISIGQNIAGSYNGTDVIDQGSYDLCIDINPTNPFDVMFGNVELSRTLNGLDINFIRNLDGPYGGSTAWDCPIHVDVHSIKFAPSNSNIVYVGCDGGIYKSSDGGTTWYDLNNGINTLQFYNIASHPTDPNIIYGGAQDNGNFATSDGGATWEFKSSGDGMNCFFDRNNASNIFISTQYGALARSTDGGVTFENLISGQTSKTAWNAPFWQHPVTPSIIYAAINRRIYQSTDYGAGPWVSLSGWEASKTISSVAQSPITYTNWMEVESQYESSPKVRRSTNEGAFWETVLELTGPIILNIVADPFDGETFYMCRATYTDSMVMRTTNMGDTWLNISVGLPSVPANDVFIDPKNRNHIYVANDFGVYFSSMAGTNNTWQKLSNGMPFVPVLDFNFYDSGSGTRYLRAASHGRGVFELNIDTPLPVELTSFLVENKGNGVLLKWQTATEVNNYGFEVQRANLSGQRSKFEKIGFIEGSGNSNSTRQYSFIDDAIINGKYSYRLKQIDLNGKFEYSDEIEIEVNLFPKEFVLFQNYPNPFNPSTTIRFGLPIDSHVKLELFDVLGKKVAELINQEMPAGFHNFQFSSVNYQLSSGMYIYRIKAGEFVQTRKLLLIK